VTDDELQAQAVEKCARARARLERATEAHPLPNGWEWADGDTRWGVTPYAYSQGNHYGRRVFVNAQAELVIENGAAPAFVVAAVLRVYFESALG
jgi:hypothetical protein